MALGTPSFLNLDFVEGILRRSDGDNSIQVIDIFTKPATNKGDNYTSDMYRVAVEFTRNQGDRKITEKKSIIVKVAPLIDGMKKDLILQSDVFNIEMSMMTDTLKKMNGLLGSKHPLNAAALYVQKEHPTLIVTEDLATFGFRMADRVAGLDLTHSLLALRGLARFHASSIAVCEKEPKQKRLYSRGIFSHDHPVELRSFFIHGAKTLADEVANWPELGPRYADKIRTMADHIYLKGIEVTECTEDDFQVINHGDFWVNNMMFKYNDEGKVIDHIFVDFQMCLYTSPGIDLQYFLNTSPSNQVTEENRELLLREYLSTLNNVMKQLGCKRTPLSMEDLERILKERALYGMIAAFTVLPLVLVESDEVKDLEEMMKKDGTYDNPSYKGKTYRNIMIKKIPIYDELGLLDV